MTYKSKTDFIRNHNVRKLGIVEILFRIRKTRFNRRTNMKMIVDKVSKSPRSVQDNFSFYKKVSQQLGG